MAKIIAIILVLIILNITLLFLLRSVAKQINRVVRRNVAESLSVYDRIVKKKEQKIQELDEYLKAHAIEEEQCVESSFYTPTSQVELDYLFTKKSYADIKFFENYDYVKKTFHFNYTKVLEAFVHMVSKRDHKNLYKDVLQGLTHQVQYDLLNLDEDEQLKLVHQALPEQYDAILKEYVKSKGTFNIVDFCEFLEWKSKINDNKIIVRMGYPDEKVKAISADIELEKDETIIEGMKIVYQNTIYDYSF